MSTPGLPEVHSPKGGVQKSAPVPGEAVVELPALNTGAVPVPEEMPPTPRRRDVDVMPSFEIMDHLRRRNCVPSGFYEDDKKKLQALFDEDYEQQKKKRQIYLAAVNANRKDNYTKQFAERKKRRDEMEISTALKNNPQVPAWLDLVKEGKCNPFVCWNGIKKPLVRYIATQLPVQSCLVGLELCRCHINDEVCELIASMLRANRSLRQLNLAENSFGSPGLKALAGALEVNDVLKFIGLRGNHLQARDGGEASIDGVVALSNMISINTSLVRINILNTGLDRRGFALISNALAQNETMLIVEMDAANSNMMDAKHINRSLARNQQSEKETIERQKIVKLEEKKAEIEAEKLVEAEREKQRHLDWIEAQRRNRIQDRKKLKEEEAEKRRIEEERRKEIAKARMELALAAAKGKKKKGKKKKKKK